MKKLMMMAIVATTMVGAAFSVALCSFAAETQPTPSGKATKPLRVLMIGNSFSASVLHETPAFAQAAGVQLNLVQCGIGGCPLERHWSNVEKAADPTFKPYSVNWSYPSDAKRRFPKKANVTEMLVADKWDIVTIQQASGQSAFEKMYEPYAGKLIAKIRELAPQAEIVIQETWSYAPYDKRLAQWGMTPQTMYDALKAAYAKLAKNYNLRMIPMGDAVQLFRARLPVNYGTLLTKEQIDAIKEPTTIDFHGDVAGSSRWEKGNKKKQANWQETRLRCDFPHLNARGHYLQACVWVAALCGVDPTTVAYCPKDIPEADAKLMRECAKAALQK